jgi:hypothetical protein
MSRLSARYGSPPILKGFGCRRCGSGSGWPLLAEDAGGRQWFDRVSTVTCGIGVATNISVRPAGCLDIGKAFEGRLSIALKESRLSRLLLSCTQSSGLIPKKCNPSVSGGTHHTEHRGLGEESEEELTQRREGGTCGVWNREGHEQRAALGEKNASSPSCSSWCRSASFLSRPYVTMKAMKSMKGRRAR